MQRQPYLLAIIFLFCSFLGKAQYFKPQNSYDVFGNYSRLGLQLDGLAYMPAQIGTPPSGTSFKSQWSLGYKAGLVYNFTIVPNFGFRIGALIGQTPAINTSFKLDASRTGESQDYIHTKGPVYSALNFSFPLLAEYRNFMLPSFVSSWAAGIQVQRTGPAVLSESYGDYYQTTVTNSGSWDMDLIFKAGIYLEFNRFMLQPSIVYKHRLTDQYTGTYTFDNLQNPSLNNFHETYVFKGNYIGLSIGIYIFTPHRQISAGCAGSVHSKQVIKRQRAKEREKRKREKKKKAALKKKKKAMRKRARNKYFK